jgi:hypothetical protein
MIIEDICNIFWIYNLKIEGKFDFLMLKLKIWNKGMET